MGHLWGWNVLQVVKLRRDGAGDGGVCVCVGGGKLRAGDSSEKTWRKKKKKERKKEKVNVFLSSLQISLTFFPLFHKNAWEEEELCICFPRVRTLLGSSKSRSLGGVWFTPHLMSQTPPTHTLKWHLANRLFQFTKYFSILFSKSVCLRSTPTRSDLNVTPC